MRNNKPAIWLSAAVVLVYAFVICYFSVRTTGKGGTEAAVMVSKGELRNTIEIPLSEAKDISIMYTSDNIKVFPAEGNTVVIKEYLSRERGADALASVSITEGKAVVTGGIRWHFILFPWINLNERIEVYLPKEGLESLKLQVNSGNISAEEDFNMQAGSIFVTAKSGNIRWQDIKALQVKMETLSGNLRVGKVVADTLILSAKSGNISGEELSGKAEFSAGSGNIRVTGFAGSGDVSTNSGGIEVEAENVTGDMTFKAGSGNVKLVVPKNLSFTAEMNTRSGKIYTDFEDEMNYNKDGNYAEGQIGETPVGKMSLKAGSGNVRLVTE